MAAPSTVDFMSLHLVGFEQIRKRWGWILALGILLAALGSVALGAATLATLATMEFIGWLMMVGGFLQAAHAFTCRGWSGFFIDLLAGLLYLVVGFMIVANPAATAVTLTLLVALFLILSGVFRVAVALMIQFQNWVWLALHGMINVILGIMIWQQWPLDGLWVIGLFVGIDMIFNGWSLIMLGLAVKNLPTPPESEHRLHSQSPPL